MKQWIGALALSMGISTALAAEVAVSVPAGTDLPRSKSAQDYGSFRWLWANAEQAAELSRIPGAKLLPEARFVQLGPNRFDPTLSRGAPLLDAKGAGLHVLQFHAPLRAEWTRGLEQGGVRVLQYLPHNAVLVWATPAALDARRSSEVRGIAPVLAEDKRDLTLAQAAPVSSRGIKVFYYADGQAELALRALVDAGGIVLEHEPAQPDRTFWQATLELPAARLADVLALPFVVNVGFEAERQLDDEQANQILAPNFATPSTLQLGYSGFLSNELGVTGQGVIWSVVDTGADRSHPDLAPAWVGGVTQGCPLGDDGQGDDGFSNTSSGHGTHVAGAVLGRGVGDGPGPAAETDANGFLYGQGVAPGAQLWSARLVCSGNTLTDTSVTRLAIEAGASGSNNSWNNGAARSGYTASARTYDVLVRDGNFDTPDLTEAFSVFFSAGNAGASGLTAPHEAKNIVSVANTGTPRSAATGLNLVNGGSSRGPAVDGRILPTLSATGTNTAAARNALGGSCSTAVAGTNNLYALCNGTSMSTPRAAGAAALVIEWYRNKFGTTPSPAMIKGMLVNGARDLPGSQPGANLTDGSRPIPNNDEGWGIIDLRATLGPAVRGLYRDQAVVLTQTGETRTLNVRAADPARPLKVTLAWTDAPGAVGASPALVNNLDLVVELAGNTYLGNVFANGSSTTGGTADTLANLENVYVVNPGSGIATIRVVGTAINADALSGNGTPTTPRQDYALICTNCRVAAELFEDGFEAP